MVHNKSESASVNAYLATLLHPHKEGVEALRQAILGIDMRIREEVKWNAPSFFLDDHFATFRLHPGATFQLVFHTGAKARSNPRQFYLDSSPGLLKWASKDRCVIAFASDADALAKRTEVIRLTKEWLAQLSDSSNVV